MFDTEAPEIDLEPVEPPSQAVPQPEAPPAMPSSADADERVRTARSNIRRRRAAATSRERSRITPPTAAEALGRSAMTSGTVG